MILSFMRDTVTRLRPTIVRDAHGNDVAGSYAETDIGYCAVLPPGVRSSVAGKESVGARDQVIADRILIAPLDTDIQAADRIRFAGLTYDVLGEPEPYAMTSLTHIAVKLRRVSG